MNIYNEAIKNVKSLDYLAEWYESDVVSDGYEEAKKNRETMTQNVIKTLERAKKEHELLGFYKTWVQEQMKYIFSIGDYTTRQIIQIEKEVEELK